MKIENALRAFEILSFVSPSASERRFAPERTAAGTTVEPLALLDLLNDGRIVVTRGKIPQAEGSALSVRTAWI